jgi:serine/threonine protein kinase
MKGHFNAYICDGKIKGKIIFFSLILTSDPPIPENLSVDASDFISKLLLKDPQRRLGGGKDDAKELKRHPFFKVS